MKVRSVAILFGSLALGACGGGMNEAAPPPRSPESAGGAAEPAAQIAPSPVPPGGGKQAPSSAQALDTAPMHVLWDEMQQAHERLDATMAGDTRNPTACYEACRALGSMDRAAGRVCEMAPEDSRCELARVAVARARTRVKNACRACADGTSTNERDPVPAPAP